MLREGILANHLSSDLETSSLPPSFRDRVPSTPVVLARRPQDYGGVVAHARVVEVIDKALGND